MTAKKYTDCVEPDNFVDLSLTFNVGIFNIILLGLIYGWAAYAVIIISGGPIAIIAAIATVTAAITYVLWWLYGRLICLDESERNCAIIGLVTSKGPSDPLTKSGDNDYTMNLLLPPGPINAENPKVLDRPKEEYSVEPQGHLVKENTKIFGVSRGYVQEGTHNIKYLKTLHCEFEGDGLLTILVALFGLLFILGLALAAYLAAASFPLLGVLLFILLWLAIIIYKIFIAKPGAPGAGTPLDIDPNLGSLADLDVVVVQGYWIYDSLHEGWNEIHPVLRCEKLGPLLPDENGQFKWSNFTWNDPKTGTAFTIDTKENVTNLKNYWCAEFENADNATGKGSKTNPEYQWDIHPIIDGCKPPDIIL